MRLRHVLIRAASEYSAPVLGAVYFAGWFFASTSKFVEPGRPTLYALFAIAIGISKRFPIWSFGLLLVTPALQIMRVIEPPESTTWPTYGSVIAVAFFIGLFATGVTRYLALPVGAVVSVLVAYCIVTGGVFLRLVYPLDLGYAPHPMFMSLMTASCTVFGLYAGGWMLGVAGASLKLRRSLTIAESRLEASSFELRLVRVREDVARDVHDELAHSLAIVVAQAEGALALQEIKPGAAVESLRNIATLSRASLIDVRRLVEKIQDGEDIVGERRSISDIAALLERFGNIGIDTTVSTIGAPQPMGSLQESAVYRIIQESLTNALKHAGTSTPSVTLAWAVGGVKVDITSPNGTPLVINGDGRGVGIAGMKERARLAGGWLEADKDTNGTFRVRAFIPTSDGTDIAEGSARLDLHGVDQ